MNFWARLVILAFVIAVVVVLLLFAPHAVLWFGGVYPVPAGTSPMYQFWSGVGLALVISGSRWINSSWRKDRCHAEHCWHLGHYPAAGGAYHVCRKHHPDPAVRDYRVTLEHIIHRHRQHLESQGIDP